MGARAGLEVDVQPTAAGSGAASAAFAELVSTAALAARERGSTGVALLIDELQAAPREDLRTLAYAWQELQLAVPEPPAVVFAVGLPNAPDVLTAAVTFSERFAFRTLRRLSSADAAEVLEGPARLAMVAWEPDLVDAVVRLADGYPYFLQLYGDALWQVVGPDEGGVLPLTALDRAKDVVDDELDTMFRARWAKAAPGERRLLVVLAELTDDRETPVRRNALADRMGVTSNDLSEPRRSLLDQGLVESADRGTLRFTVPGFATFVRTESGS